MRRASAATVLRSYLRNTVAAEARALDAPEVTEAAFS